MEHPYLENESDMCSLPEFPPWDRILGEISVLSTPSPIPHATASGELPRLGGRTNTCLAPPPVSPLTPDRLSAEVQELVTWALTCLHALLRERDFHHRRRPVYLTSIDVNSDNLTIASPGGMAQRPSSIFFLTQRKT